MQTKRQNGTLTVTGLRQLSAANARSFRIAVASVLSPDLQAIEIDFSEVQSVDGCGLGALMSVYQAASQQRSEGDLRLRLLNPAPPVQQMIELTRLHHLFEVTSSPAAAQDAVRPSA